MADSIFSLEKGMARGYYGQEDQEITLNGYHTGAVTADSVRVYCFLSRYYADDA
jgi:hypothetical protein